MTDSAASQSSPNKIKKIVVGIAALVVVAAVGALVIWATTCPCERTPGFVLLGEGAETPVDDWGFVNDVPLCQIQIYAGWRPHAVNLNCMATPEGELFLSCSVCTRKYWAGEVEVNEPGRLRLNGVVYPVIVNREMDPAALDRAWAARVKKLQVHGGGPFNPVPDPDAQRPEHWWSFHLESSI